MTEGYPRPKVSEQAARPSGRKDYPAKRATVSTRSVTPPDGGTSATEDQTVSSHIMSPSDLTRARELYIDILAGLRRTRGIGTNYENELAEIMKADKAVFSDFRLGLTETPDMRTIIKALGAYISPDDSRLVELRELQPPEDTTQAQGSEEARETLSSEPDEVRWLRTLTQAQEGMTPGDALRLLRLSMGLGAGEFASKIGRKKNGKVSVLENENNKQSPTTDINMIIAAAEFDPHGKPAQLLRLQTWKLDVWSVNQLEQCSFIQLMRYLRAQRGIGVYELGRQLGYSERSGMISALENSEGNGNKFLISEKAVEDFITLLQLSPDSTLAGIIRSKYKNAKDSTSLQKQISPDVLNRVLEEGYLFAEHLEVPDYPLSEQDRLLREELEGRSTLEEKITYLMQVKKGQKDLSTQQKFWKTDKSFRNYVDTLKRRLKGGGSHVQLSTLVRFLMVYGYDIHHPITWDFLNSARSLGGDVDQE